MSKIEEVRVPHLGDFGDVPVIDVLVAPGDHVEPEDALITLESDKASMDVPSPLAGTVKELKIALGDHVSEGSVILSLELDGAAEAPPAERRDPPPEPRASATRETARSEGDRPSDGDREEVAPDAAATSEIEVKVPDIGDFRDVPVVEVMISEGDEVNADDALITLESDKAAMDVPAPIAGTVMLIRVKVGDRLSQGDRILTLAVRAEASSPAAELSPPRGPEAPQPSSGEPVVSGARVAITSSEDPRAPVWRPPPTTSEVGEAPTRPSSHATPGLRRFARELGVDLSRVTGTGRKGRILREDVGGFVKAELSRPSRPADVTPGIPAMPEIDFATFGEIETRPLSRIKRLAGKNLHRAWLTVPHVTHHDEADISELERFRKAESEAAKERGVRLTLLAFIMKGCVHALTRFPPFNASLDPKGENLILKHYYHLGIAVDTPDGLVVPVIRDVDRKPVEALAQELAAVSARARDKKLSPSDVQGASFTISSLGGIGGTAFTPIVNAPEVAILGVARSSHRPVWTGHEFVPRLMLPVSLSYDHRVIDGAQAARFTRHLCEVLGDIRKLLL